MSGASPFDPSVENHFRPMDNISVLCGEETGPVEEAEMSDEPNLTASSIPLTLKSSTSPPRDLIPAGCHNGMDALWKFSASSTSKENYPRLQIICGLASENLFKARSSVFLESLIRLTTLKSPPRDLIPAGCHNGMDALWKYSESSTSKDIRPILRIDAADIVPIRTLAWAPSEGDTEDGILVVNTPLPDAPYPMKRSTNRIIEFRSKSMAKQRRWLCYGRASMPGDYSAPLS